MRICPPLRVSPDERGRTSSYTRAILDSLHAFMSPATATPHASYRPSGRIAWHAPLVVLAIGIPSAIVLAAAYTAIAHYNPLVYFNCLASFAFGGFLGLMVGKACRIGISRSRAFNATSGFAVGAFALWLHWLLWTWLMFDDGGATLRHLATGGVGTWSDFFTWASEHRHLSLGRFSSSGHSDELSPGFLIWTWRAEAFAVLLLSTTVPLGAIRPYSEVVRQWARKDWSGEFPVHPSTPIDRAGVERQLSSEGTGWLATLSGDRDLAGKVPDLRLRLTCESVRGDPSCAFISVVKVTRRQGKSDVTTNLLTNRRLEARAYEQLLKALT